MISSLDEYSIVKEGENYEKAFYLMNHVKKSKHLLPTWNIRCYKHCFYPPGCTMILLKGKFKNNYKILHLYESVNKCVGCKILEIRSGKVFEWRNDDIPALGDDLAHNPNSYKHCHNYVTVGNKYVFWDVKSEKYVMRFNPDSEKFSKIELPKDDARDASFEGCRFLFNDNGKLVVWYVTNEHAMIYELKYVIRSEWEFVKNIRHTQ